MKSNNHISPSITHQSTQHSHYLLQYRYLEREFESFPNASLDELIKHALKALSVSLSGEAELDAKSASISIVGADTTFSILEGEKLQSYLDAVEQEGGVEPIATEDVEMEEPEI